MCILNYILKGLPKEDLRTKEATGGGGGRKPNKILSQEPDLCPTFKTPSKKPLKESDENTNQ
jgi:hypothetical protein